MPNTKRKPPRYSLLVLIYILLSIDKAFQKVGLPLGGDCNDADAPAMGLFHLEAAIDKRGRRISAFQAFLNKKTAQDSRKARSPHNMSVKSSIKHCLAQH